MVASAFSSDNERQEVPVGRYVWWMDVLGRTLELESSTIE